MNVVGSRSSKNKKEILKQEKYEQAKKDLDFWLRHEMQLGTNQIKKLWLKLDGVF